MKLPKRNRNRARRPTPAAAQSVRREQKTTPTKALVALLVTLAGLVGITMTHGTAELVVGLGQLLLVTYGVWRARNVPVDPPRGPGAGGLL